jgi:hypothetical protein
LWTHKALQQHVRQTLSVQPVRKALKGVDLVPAMSTAMGRYRVQHAQARLDAQLMAPRAWMLLVWRTSSSVKLE